MIVSASGNHTGSFTIINKIRHKKTPLHCFICEHLVSNATVLFLGERDV